MCRSPVTGHIVPQGTSELRTRRRPWRKVLSTAGGSAVHRGRRRLSRARTAPGQWHFKSRRPTDTATVQWAARAVVPPHRPKPRPRRSGPSGGEEAAVGAAAGTLRGSSPVFGGWGGGAQRSERTLASRPHSGTHNAP